MIDILTAPAAGIAAQELTSQPHLGPLVDAALASYRDWTAATAALHAENGTAYAVKAAQLANHDAFLRHGRRLMTLAEATGDYMRADAGIRYLHQADAVWEHALDNPDEYAGF